MRVAAVQMCSTTDIAENISAASALVTMAAKAGATFIATPEMTHFLQKDAKALRQSVKTQEEDEGVRAFSQLAESLSIYLLIGSLAILRADGQIANRSFLFSPEGDIIETYDKIHLFEAAISKSETYRESDTYTAGMQPKLADLAELTLGLSICYDVRFPDLYAQYAKAEAHMISVPAAFTVATGKAHWETLLRARAIETGAYVIAPAQGGKHDDGRRTWGRSLIVNPWGEVIARLDHDEPGYILSDVSSASVTQARARIPAWQGRVA